MNYKIFSRGPSIKASFHSKQGIIQKVQLDLFDNGMKIEVNEKSLENSIYEWIECYLTKKIKNIFLPLDNLPIYTKEVLNYLKTIPFGEIKSYKEIAEITGKPQGARAVGNACGKNPFPLLIPCHRVITTNKRLGGFSGGTEVKRRLLEFEGITLA